jgi:ferredoxin-NADP reductase
MGGTRQTLIVSDCTPDRGDILRLRLVAGAGARLVPFTAGAHLDVWLPGAGLWRQYSLCSDPAEAGHWEIGVLRDPNGRGGSVALHGMARPGALFEIEGPRNHFPLDESAGMTVLFGGGIGITPLLAMAWRLHALGRDFTLHYCTRSEAVTAFLDMLRDAPFADRVVFHFDDAAPGQRLDLGRDLPPPGPDTHLYVCGPQGFMDWVIGTAEAAGHASARVHREYFSAAIDRSGESFEVQAARSGVSVIVGPDDTIARALARSGLRIEVKCEEGVCGTCVTDVLEGIPDHRDRFLTEDERDEGTMICACCSRARGARLVLDL